MSLVISYFHGVSGWYENREYLAQNPGDQDAIDQVDMDTDDFYSSDLFNPIYSTIKSGSTNNILPFNNDGAKYRIGNNDISTPENDHKLIAIGPVMSFDSTFTYTYSMRLSRIKSLAATYGSGLFSIGLIGYAEDGVTPVDPFGGNNIELLHAHCACNSALTDNFGAGTNLNLITGSTSGWGATTGDMQSSAQLGHAGKMHPDVRFIQLAIRLNHSEMSQSNPGQPMPGTVMLQSVQLITPSASSSPTVNSVLTDASNYKWGEKINVKAAMANIDASYTAEARVVLETGGAIDNLTLPRTVVMNKSVDEFSAQFQIFSSYSTTPPPGTLRIAVDLKNSSGTVVSTKTSNILNIGEGNIVLTKSTDKDSTKAMAWGDTINVAINAKNFNSSTDSITAEIYDAQGELVTMPFAGFTAGQIATGQVKTFSVDSGTGNGSVSFQTSALAVNETRPDGTFKLKITVNEIDYQTAQPKVTTEILGPFKVTSSPPSLTVTTSSDSSRVVEFNKDMSITVAADNLKSTDTVNLYITQVSSGLSNAPFSFRRATSPPIVGRFTVTEVSSDQQIVQLTFSGGICNLTISNMALESYSAQSDDQSEMVGTPVSISMPKIGGTFKLKLVTNYVDKDGAPQQSVIYSDQFSVGGGYKDIIGDTLFESSFYFSNQALWDQYETEIAANDFTHQVEFEALKEQAQSRFLEKWDVFYGSIDLIRPVAGNLKVGTGAGNGDDQLMIVSKDIFPFNPMSIYKWKAVYGQLPSPLGYAGWMSIGMIGYGDDGITPIDFNGQGNQFNFFMHGVSEQHVAHPTVELGFTGGESSTGGTALAFQSATSDTPISVYSGVKFFRVAILFNHGELQYRPFSSNRGINRIDYLRLTEYPIPVGESLGGSVYTITPNKTVMQRWEALTVTLTATNFTDGFVFVTMEDITGDLDPNDYAWSRYGILTQDVFIISGTGSTTFIKIKPSGGWNGGFGQETFKIKFRTGSPTGPVVAETDVITVAGYYNVYTSVSFRSADGVPGFAKLESLGSGEFIVATDMPFGTELICSTDFSPYIDSMTLNGSPTSTVKFLIESDGRSKLKINFKDELPENQIYTLTIESAPSIGYDPLIKPYFIFLTKSALENGDIDDYVRIEYPENRASNKYKVPPPPAPYIPKGPLGIEICDTDGNPYFRVDTDAIMIQSAGTVTFNYSSIGTSTQTIYVAGLEADKDWEVFVYNQAAVTFHADGTPTYQVESEVFNGYFLIHYSRYQSSAPTNIVFSYAISRIRN